MKGREDLGIFSLTQDDFMAQGASELCRYFFQQGAGCSAVQIYWAALVGLLTSREAVWGNTNIGLVFMWP